MKILFVNKFFHINGGSETVFFQEKNFFVENGHGIIDFSMADDRNFFSPFANFFVPNIEYINTGKVTSKFQQALSFIHSSVAVNQLASLIQQEKPEIAHLHNIYHQLTPSIIPHLKRKGIKVVLTLHDSKLVCPAYLALNKDEICNACKGKYFWEPFFSNCQNSRLKGLLLSAEAIFHKWKGSYDNVDLFLAPSQFMANQISQRIPAEKIRVLHNGIDIEKYQASYNDEGYGLYFGRISREKGIKSLLKAHSIIPQPFPLKVVGTGPLETDLKERYPAIEFFGYKSGVELNSLIANAAFIIVPSECYENCSMVVLESMAFGKPVIGSRVGGIPEQIDAGKTGFLFEMGNIKELAEKMMLLANDKSLRQKLGKNARQKLENEYSLTDHCQKLENIYKGLLQ